MRSLTLSPLAFAREALAVGAKALPLYSHPKSPHKFTQPQLFAVLALKDFLKQGYRGIEQIVKEWSEMRTALAVKKVPTYSALAKAEKRLLKKRGVEALLDETVQEAQRKGMLGTRSRQVSLDSTGYENGHTSVYYGQRTGEKKRHFPKFTAMMDTASHVYLSGVMNQGPHPDQREFRQTVQSGYVRLAFGELLADAAYDSELNHVWVHGTLKARSIIPPRIGRPTAKPPTGRYRRALARRFPRKRYGQRWQSESGFSQDKRRFGSAIEGRGYWPRCRKLNLRLLVHNVALLLRVLHLVSLNRPWLQAA